MGKNSHSFFMLGISQINSINCQNCISNMQPSASIGRLTRMNLRDQDGNTMLLSTLREQQASVFKVFASSELPVFVNSTFKTNTLTLLYVKHVNTIMPLLFCILHASCNSECLRGRICRRLTLDIQRSRSVSMMLLQNSI